MRLKLTKNVENSKLKSRRKTAYDNEYPKL